MRIFGIPQEEFGVSAANCQAGRNPILRVLQPNDPDSYDASRELVPGDMLNDLNSDTSRPLEKPMNGRIAVKVINHLGAEVMKVVRVDGIGKGTT